jgi:hypothetical protein
MQKRKTGKANDDWIAEEVSVARQQWTGQVNGTAESWLGAILRRTGLRVSRRELLLIDGALYVSHAGLLALARRNRCAGIQSEVIAELSCPEQRRWVVKASVLKSPRSAHPFVALGDADPSNVSSRVRGSELRVAETRAVNRALRKAYGVGICSVEEIGSAGEFLLQSSARVQQERSGAANPPDTGSTTVGPNVRDRLKLILREHQLDPTQVHAYGCRFIGVSDLSDASADSLARFVAHLEQFAIANRIWLDAELGRAKSSLNDNSQKTEPQDDAA